MKIRLTQPQVELEAWAELGKIRGKDSTNANWGLISQGAQVCKPGLSLCMLRGSE